MLLERDALASGIGAIERARAHALHERVGRPAGVGELSGVPRLAGADGRPAVFTHTGFVNVGAPEFAEHLRRNVRCSRHGSTPRPSRPASWPSISRRPASTTSGPPLTSRIAATRARWTWSRASGAASARWGVRCASGTRSRGWSARGAASPASRPRGDRSTRARWWWRPGPGRSACAGDGDPAPRPRQGDRHRARQRPPEMRDPHLIFIDNVLGTYSPGERNPHPRRRPVPRVGHRPGYSAPDFRRRRRRAAPSC